MRIKIDESLSLNSIQVKKDEIKKETGLPTNHIMVIDCSGSMCGELPKIRHQLKNKLPTLVKEGDTVSMVWFSSRDMFGTLAEKVKVSDMTDLQRLNTAIDRWLKPMSLTGFVQPLQEVLRIASTASGAYSLFFLTDGYDNQWQKNEILKAMADLKDVLSGAVIVEYGWNCNRPLMAEMAEEVGGNLVFCEGFEAYDPIVANTLSKSFKSSKKVEVKVGDPLHGLVFSVSDGGACVYKVEKGKVQVPADTAEIWMIEEKGEGTPIAHVASPDSLRPVYQSVAVLSQRMRSKTVKKILAGLGDKRLWDKYANCFGKQNLSDFQGMAVEASSIDDMMFKDGRDYDLLVDDNAFTIVDLLFALIDDKENMFIPSKMEYNKIGRSTVDAMDDLTDEEREEITAMTAKAKTAKDFTAIQERMKEIEKSKPAALKFKITDDGEYSLSNLVWNETRPNVSIQIRQQGTVELPDNEHINSGKVPSTFPTFRFRNYTIVRDGIANIDLLPVKLSKNTFDLLKSKKVIAGTWAKDNLFIIDIRSLPTINQNMIKNISAKELFNLEYILTRLKAAQKVYKDYKVKWVGKKTSEGFKDLYGDEATAWLESMGLKDYSGFSPKTKLAEPTDFYMGVELEVKIKGLSSLPPVNKVAEKMKAKKDLTFVEGLMEPFIKVCQDIDQRPDVEKKTWIEEKERLAVSEVRKTIRRMAEIKFGVVVGQVWFEEFASMDEKTLEMDFNGKKVECTADLKSIEIKI